MLVHNDIVDDDIPFVGYGDEDKCQKISKQVVSGEAEIHKVLIIEHLVLYKDSCK